MKFTVKLRATETVVVALDLATLCNVTQIGINVIIMHADCLAD